MASEVVKKYIGEWLSNRTPAELDQMAAFNVSLVDELKPYSTQVRMAKVFVRDFHMTPDELLTWMYNRYPGHAMVLESNREWFRENVGALTRYIESL